MTLCQLVKKGYLKKMWMCTTLSLHKSTSKTIILRYMLPYLHLSDITQVNNQIVVHYRRNMSLSQLPITRYDCSVQPIPGYQWNEWQITRRTLLYKIIGIQGVAKVLVQTLPTEYTIFHQQKVTLKNFLQKYALFYSCFTMESMN